MSRIPDLLSLMESANDFYLVAPGRNDRSVYIQVDDICELAMKSWLHEDTLRRQKECEDELIQERLLNGAKHKKALRDFFNGSARPVDLKKALGIAANTAKRKLLNSILKKHQTPKEWSLDKDNERKNFEPIVNDVKALRPIGATTENQELHDVLDRFVDRRKNRNGFFHDHTKTGLTIESQNCLNALTDIYRLCELLFGASFREEARKPEQMTYRLQVVLIRLKQQSAGRDEPLTLYELSYLRKQPQIILAPAFGCFEYRLVHQDAFALYDGIKAKFDEQIVVYNREIARIGAIARPTVAHLDKLQNAQASANALIETWRECFGENWEPPKE